jgi:hypothetical protein
LVSALHDPLYRLLLLELLLLAAFRASERLREICLCANVLGFRLALTVELFDVEIPYALYLGAELSRPLWRDGLQRTKGDGGEGREATFSRGLLPGEC